MCARRFLFLIFLLTLLVVGGSVAIYQWGGNVLLRQATPQGRFQPPPGGGAPAYADSGYWLATPGMADNPSDWRPQNVPDGAGNRTAAVFYVHPTTYLNRDRWNAPFEADAQTEFRTRLFVQSQASAYNEVGEIWSPRYRQAAFGAFLLKTADAQKALAFAYRDVEFALDEFLRQVPSGKPLILAGHSQGALHLSRLLKERRDALKGRLVAAYVVGWPLSTIADLPAMGLSACAKPDEAGCILSWQSFGDPANPDMVLDAWEGTEGPTGTRRLRANMLCVNPLTGTFNGRSGPGDQAGTIVPTADLRSAISTNGISARCENGFLIIDGAVPAMGPYVLPGNNYHVYDYALFWGAIRRDAARRLAAWQR